MTQVFVAVERIVSQQQAPSADFIIAPKVGHIRWDQSRRADELVKIGYETALASIDQIKNLIDRKTLSLNTAA
jgi:predicted acylesterase/phospholipase RssA